MLWRNSIVEAAPLELESVPEKSREQRVRDLFAEVGGSMTTARLAVVSVDRGIWTQRELAKFRYQAIQAFVRRALRGLDMTGLPFAGMTVERDEETNAPVWCQRTLWELVDYELNIKELEDQRAKLQTVAVGLRKECELRYGKAPGAAA